MKGGARLSVQRKRELFLVLGLLLIGGILALLLYPRDTGYAIQISVDGNELATYPLAVDRTIPITGVNGENLLVIENGFAWITEADCPDHLCEKMPKISRVGETIVCLPHRVVVTVLGAEHGADTILQRLPPAREVAL